MGSLLCPPAGHGLQHTVSSSQSAPVSGREARTTIKNLEQSLKSRRSSATHPPKKDNIPKWTLRVNGRASSVRKTFRSRSSPRYGRGKPLDCSFVKCLNPLISATCCSALFSVRQGDTFVPWRKKKTPRRSYLFGVHLSQPLSPSLSFSLPLFLSLSHAHTHTHAQTHTHTHTHTHTRTKVTFPVRAERLTVTF